ncbi:MAG: NusA-like transcription termination signal-binding factor [Thermoplasmata archaeon]
MTEIRFDNETLGYVRLFEEATGARVHDCFSIEEKLVLLVEAEDLAKAVGPGGARVERLKALIKREIMVVADADDPSVLAKNIFYAYQPRSVEIGVKGRVRHATVTVDPAWKARAIGTQGKNLKIARAILLRHTDIGSVSVA